VERHVDTATGPVVYARGREGGLAAAAAVAVRSPPLVLLLFDDIKTTGMCVTRGLHMEPSAPSTEWRAMVSHLLCGQLPTCRWRHI
jgi:hypothetical protein